jgi:hypothetical protein
VEILPKKEAKVQVIVAAADLSAKYDYMPLPFRWRLFL